MRATPQYQLVPAGRLGLLPSRQRQKRSRRKLSHTFTWLLIVIGLAGAAYFGMAAIATKKLEPAKTYSAPIVNPDQKYLPYSVPTHVKIASVGIDDNITPVGLDANKSIQMPPLFDWITGWYKYSPTPGQKGPSVIVGHVDNYKGISVFWHLRDIKPGNMIQVTRSDGTVANFKVISLKQFDKKNFPTKDVYGNIDYAGLRLITCGGAFDTSTHDYTQNTIVYAMLVSSSKTKTS